MLEFATVVFSLLFVAGAVAYWWISKPLASLPTYQDLMEAAGK